MERAQNSAQWWSETDDGVAACLRKVAGLVHDQNGWRRSRNRLHAAMYENGAEVGLMSYVNRGASAAYRPATLPDNIARSVVDSLTAKIAKHRPLPMVLTQRGDWEQQKRAKKASQYLEGEFYRQRVFERKGPQVVKDAATFGTGLVKVFRDGRRVCTERVLPWEVMVDEWDARHGAPRNMYHVCPLDRGVALERFARTDSGGWRTSLKEAIECAPAWIGGDDDGTGDNATVDRIKVVEAWHLCDNEEAHEFDESHKCNGRHVIAIEDVAVVDEEWAHQVFPFEWLNYEEPVTGLWGTGLVQQVEGYQAELNIMNERTQEAHRLSTVFICIADGSGIVDTEVRNGVGTIIKHKPGFKPEILPVDLVNQAHEARIRDLGQRAFNQTGISQMSAQSQKAPGVTSGVAIQSLDDIETERFIVFGRAYENWCLGVARHLLRCVAEVAEIYGEHEVKVKMGSGLLPLKWSEVKVDGFELRVFPTSLLPQQLGARQEKLMTLFNAQIIDRSTFLRQLGAPDLDAELDQETSDQENVDERIEVMLDAGEDKGDAAYMPPHPFLNLEWAAKRAQQRLNKAEIDGVPEYNLELLRRFITDCATIASRAEPQQPMQPPAPGPVPQ